MKDDMALSMVVLPEPVPPEMMTFIRACTRPLRSCAALPDSAPASTSLSIV